MSHDLKSIVHLIFVAARQGVTPHLKWSLKTISINDGRHGANKCVKSGDKMVDKVINKCNNKGGDKT